MFPNLAAVIKSRKYTELRNEILKLLIYIENEKVKRHVLHSIVEAFVDSRLININIYVAVVTHQRNSFLVNRACRDSFPSLAS